MMIPVFGVIFFMAFCDGYVPHTTFRTDRRTYFVYEVSRAYPQAIQFCHHHGHDNLAKLCDPHDLTQVLPTPGDRKIFWIRDPSICSHVGSCMTLWFDNTRYTHWVLKCSKCTQPWYVICETEEPNNVTLPAPLVPVTTRQITACSQTTIVLNTVIYVILPLVTTYENASLLCRNKYNGNLMDGTVAKVEQAEIKRALAASIVPNFWLKGTGSKSCSVMTSSNILDSLCSDIHGTMCSMNSLTMQTSFFDTQDNGPLPRAMLYIKDISESNVTSSVGILSSGLARSTMDCAAFCTNNIYCQSFVYSMQYGLCRLHNHGMAPVTAITSGPGSEFYFKNNVETNKYNNGT